VSAKPDPSEQALDDALEQSSVFDGPPPSIDELLANEDVDGLFELGAAYQRGGSTIEKDAFKAVECFEAASRLGSAEAEYFVGVAFMNGLGVSKEISEGAKRMRSAAQRGSLRAKVYVANLYEMGVHYAADRDKADVWYRNVARAAGIEDGPDSEAYELAMAELGCVRFCLQLVSDQALATKDRAFYLKKAKAMGYGHRLAQAKRETAAPIEALMAPETAAEPEAEAKPAGEPEANEAEPSPEKEPSPEPEEEPSVPLGSKWTFGAGLLAFVPAAAFAVAAFYTAWLASEGSRALAEVGRTLPAIGENHDLLFGAVLVAFGLGPATAVYRPNVVAVAAILGGGAAAGGWFLHASEALLWSPAAQAGAFGLAAAMLVLLVVGLLGGTRARGTVDGRSEP